MTRLHAAVLFAIALPGHAAGAGPRAQVDSTAPAAASLATDDDKTFYALGRMLGSRVAPLKLSAAEIRTLLMGFEDAAGGRAEQAPVDTYGPKIEALLRSRASADLEARRARDKALTDAAASEPDAVTTASGLVFKTLRPGTGASPSATSLVQVSYRGKLSDGSVFDDSSQRREASEFKMDQVIPCWAEALQRMKVGEKARLVCPSSIAYGEHGRPPAIPPGAALAFEVELQDVREAPPALPPPHE